MGAIRRFIDRRRHGNGDFGFLFEPDDGGRQVSLDLETTGLDPRSDHILSIAAVPVEGPRVLLSQRFERVIRPERSFGIESIRHHRITPAEAAAGVGVREGVEDLLRWLGNRPIIGYHIAFDLAMLDGHVRAVAGFALPNRSQDLAMAYRRVATLGQAYGEVDLGFEAIAARLGIPVLGRHTALGDAATTAACWVALHRGGVHASLD